MNPSQNAEEMDKKYVEDAPSTEFASLLEEVPKKEGVQEVSVGQRVSGKIQEIGDSYAFVDFGWRSEAVINLEDLRDRKGDIQYAPGDPSSFYQGNQQIRVGQAYVPTGDYSGVFSF